MQINKAIPINPTNPFTTDIGRIGHYEWDDGPAPFHSGRYHVVLNDGKTIEFLSFIPADMANAVLAGSKDYIINQGLLMQPYTSRWVVVVRRWTVLQVDNRDVELQLLSKVVGAANTLDDCERYVQTWFDYLVDALYASLEAWIDNALVESMEQATRSLVTDPPLGSNDDSRQQSD